jgi:2-methylaconitate cis-trans-isomerase PrpF
VYGDQTMIRIALYRGGTSKGVFLLENDLPSDPTLRDRLVLAIFGSPDPRQIDGLGGADSLTSKVAIISRSSQAGADVDYTFGQVSLVAPLIDYSGNCGNISSAVGPFAIDEGLVKAVEPVTRVRIHNTNTNKLIVAQVPVVGGKAAAIGDCQIHGVPGTGARVLIDFQGSEGAVTGLLLPTGQAREMLELGDGRNLPVSIVDAGNPCVFARAIDLGIEGALLPPEINEDPALLATLEEIRGKAAQRIGLVHDWRKATGRSPSVPKMIIISQAASYQTSEGATMKRSQVDLVARAMSMQKAHKAYPVTGTICTGVAAQIEGTLVQEVTDGSPLSQVRIGHPSGIISVRVSVEQSEGDVTVRRAEVERTARRLLSGYAHVPNRGIPPR